MTKLHLYLEARNESLSAFARRIGRSASTLTRALYGQRAPSFSLALDVERGTEAAVSADDFLSACMTAHRASISCASLADGSFQSPVGSSAGEAGASLPPANPSDAPAISEQGRAEVAHRVHTPDVAGSNPVPATSFNSPDSLLPSGENAGAQHSLAGCVPAAFAEGLR